MHILSQGHIIKTFKIFLEWFYDILLRIFLGVFLKEKFKKK